MARWAGRSTTRCRAPQRPEQGILRIRKELGLFANLRPALMFPELVGASTLKPEVVSGLDIMIIRELTGDIYFGEPRGGATMPAASAKATTRCSTASRKSAASPRSASRTALKRGKKLCSVDKENVLETSRFWREIVTDVAKKYPQVALSHMYVDNAAMQLVRGPKQFDVIVTGNMFGDILSDEASMLTGSIGMLPSASLDASSKGLYEPIHGSAPGYRRQEHRQSAGHHPLVSHDAALHVQPGRMGVSHRGGGRSGCWRRACARPISTKPGTRKVGTREMGDAVVAAL